MRKNGLTLAELIVTCLVVSIMSTLAVSSAISDIPQHKVNDALIDIEQVINQAKSIAVRESRTIITDFSSATTNHNDNGGLIQIKQTDNTVILSVYLYKNILFSAGGSTVDSSEIRFDYLGQPVDDTNDINGISDSNNLITINYSKNGNIYCARSLRIEPVTGNIEFE